MADSVTLRPDRARLRAIILQAAFLALVASTRLYSYLLFHTLAEFYSIVIAATFFIISWQTRGFNEFPGLVNLGLSYLFVGILDIFHTLSFAGMPVFEGYPFPANQVWVISRFLEAVSLLSFTFWTFTSRRSHLLFLGGLGAYTTLGLASIFVFRIFPACFVVGQGQTAFKVTMEGVIIAILLAAAGVLLARPRLFPARIRFNLLLSILLTALSELPFALYFSNYDVLNLVGHLIKILSFYLVYRSIIVTGLERPQEFLYQRLQQHEKALSEANETQGTVLSVLAHDLRGPLGSVASIAEDLSSRKDEVAGADSRELLDALAEATRSSLDLVEGILAWANAHRQDLTPTLEPLALGPVWEAQAGLLKAPRELKGIGLEADIPGEARVLADVDMLGAVLRNYLHNALKFSPLASTIHVQAEDLGKAWRLSVRDEGRGMDEETKAVLFQFAGRRAGRGTSGERGAGLGLSLVKGFVDRMGGTVEVTSAPGAGSTFAVVLPKA